MTRRKEEEGGELTEDDLQLVTFKLGDETFGVNVEQIREIVKLEEITRVPRMPTFIEGVINLRGLITTVIDLGHRFGIDGQGHTANSRIIIAEIGENQLGLIVDSVKDVIRVANRSLSPPPRMMSSQVDTRFLMGICKLPKQLVMLLDLGRVLSDEELEEVKEVSAASNETGAGDVALDDGMAGQEVPAVAPS